MLVTSRSPFNRRRNKTRWKTCRWQIFIINNLYTIVTIRPKKKKNNKINSLSFLFLQLYHEYSKSILSISKKKRNLIFSIFLGLYDTYSSMRFQSRPVNDSSHKECRLNSLLNKKKLKKERKKERKRKKEEEAVIRNRINRSFNLSNTS